MQAIRLTAKTTAALIRKVLKNAFPAAKFRVTMGRGASSVTVRWMDGPTVTRVNELVKPFQDGHFDGMQDMHVSAKGTDRYIVVEGQTYELGCRYVFAERAISPELANKCIAQVAAYWGNLTNLPTVIASDYDGSFKFADAADYRRAIRPDLPSHSHDWSSMIYLAAGDRSHFAREVIA